MSQSPSSLVRVLHVFCCDFPPPRALIGLPCGKVGVVGRCEVTGPLYEVGYAKTD